MIALSHKILVFSLLLMAILQNVNVSAQRTELDEVLQPFYRPFRQFLLQLAGRSGDDERNVKRARSLGKSQKSRNQRTRSLINFCDAENGPGKRSTTPPTSVHRLRPGDIDIIGAIGDSLTAGTGIFATNLLHLTVENRGAAFSIGGRGTWREYLTLPNILKEFNPNLYGYSLRDGLASDRSSKFNVAELGAMSRDVPYEAKVLVKRLRHDAKVNLTHHWKLITIFIGNNDFCSDICYYDNPAETVKWHERNMLTTYRYLRDNVPRLIINVIPPPNLIFLNHLTGLTPRCRIFLSMECPCLFGKSKDYLKYYDNIIKQWIAKDLEIAGRDEFNTETFTINIQPFTLFKDFVWQNNGKSDFRVLSEDCFHLSQLGQAASANGLWNNMLETADEKTFIPSVLFETFRCPTEARPYIITRVNSKPDFEMN